MNSISKEDALKIAKEWDEIAMKEDNVGLMEDMIEIIRYIENSLRLDELKETGFWKEDDVTYMIEELQFPHDENCSGTMCNCAKRNKKIGVIK